MRIFSYRNKRALRRALFIAGGVLLLLLALYISRFVYLQRYITYSDSGAKLDYSQKIRPTGQTPEALDPEQYPFEIIVDTTPQSSGDADTRKQFSGYYITTRMLAKDVDAVRKALNELDGLTTVMIDVKSVFGYYYYSSEQTGAQTADADIQAVDALIADLTKRSGLTVIAHVPAFSEPLYAFEHQSDSLALYSGALWMDEQRCYWLNPNSTAVQGLLSSIAIELSGLGFDEVVFDDFYVPASDAIAWNAAVSKEDAILNAAKNIVDNLEGVGIHVSFGSTSPALAAYGYHLFDRTDDPADVMDVMDAMQDAMEDIPAQLVFVTTRATRASASAASFCR